MLEARPITFRQASAFVSKFHRHHRPPQGCKFCVSAYANGSIIGVAQCGRPIARVYDDGVTLEISRTCTDGTPNANSFLYGRCRTIAKAMGYRRIVTYTQADESGSSLRAAGFVRVKELSARKSWAGHSRKRIWPNAISGYAGGVDRVLWEVRF